MQISEKALGYLKQLHATGLYGQSVEEVMERLICESIRQLIKDGILFQAMSEIEKGPRCSNCGSPRLNELVAMGHEEYQCLDCDHRMLGPLP